MTAPTFNIFKVLEKDDKELIHSAFFKFLMQIDTAFYTNFLQLEGDFSEPLLEKGYVGPQGEKVRFDIEAERSDRGALLLIENKFKSFPSREQIELYNSVLQTYHKNKLHYKYLICFDKQVVQQVEGWRLRDYKDIMSFIASNYDLTATDDTGVFIKHYYFLLQDYFLQYDALKKDMRPLFANSKNRSNNFWLKLFYHALKRSLDNYFSQFNVPAEVYVNRGNTMTPLLNIVPLHWDSGSQKRLLIQFQGDELKFYLNCQDREMLSGLLLIAHECFEPGSYSLKKLTHKESKTCYILKTRITKEHSATPITIDTVFDLVIAFYKMLDENLICRFLNRENGQ